MKIYLDNWCCNRPFDEQKALIIRLETQAKMSIQQLVIDGKIELAYSFVLLEEVANNPFE